MSTQPIESNVEDELAHLLARRMYVHFHNHRKTHPRPRPFVTEWCQDYADMCVRAFLDDPDLESMYDDDYPEAVVQRLRSEYR